MKPLLLNRDDRFLRHLEGVPHLESPRRLEAIYGVLPTPSLAGKWSLVAPRLATPEEIAWVHRPDYVERVAETAARPLSSLDLDTQATPHSYDVARLAVGTVFSMLDGLWTGEAKRGFALIRPPGHHAEPDKAMGFCLFNNVALAARYLKERYGAKRVMIVDIDVHHGNGTQAAFYDTNDVLYVSLHQFPAYPGTGALGEIGRGEGEGFTVNVPLPKGQRGRDLARIIHFLVRPLAEAYRPEALLVSCGFDLYLHDPLGGMRVTPGGYAVLTFFLLEIAEKVCGGRILFVMEGGYSLRGIRECGLRVLQELCDVSTLSREVIEKTMGPRSAPISLMRKVIEIHKRYWDLPF